MGQYQSSDPQRGEHFVSALSTAVACEGLRETITIGDPATSNADQRIEIDWLSSIAVTVTSARAGEGRSGLSDTVFAELSFRPAVSTSAEAEAGADKAVTVVLPLSSEDAIHRNESYFYEDRLQGPTLIVAGESVLLPAEADLSHILYKCSLLNEWADSRFFDFKPSARFPVVCARSYSGTGFSAGGGSGSDTGASSPVLGRFMVTDREVGVRTHDLRAKFSTPDGMSTVFTLGKSSMLALRQLNSILEARFSILWGDRENTEDSAGSSETDVADSPGGSDNPPSQRRSTRNVTHGEMGHSTGTAATFPDILSAFGRLCSGVNGAGAGAGAGGPASASTTDPVIVPLLRCVHAERVPVYADALLPPTTDAIGPFYVVASPAIPVHLVITRIQGMLAHRVTHRAHPEVHNPRGEGVDHARAHCPLLLVCFRGEDGKTRRFLSTPHEHEEGTADRLCSSVMFSTIADERRHGESIVLMPLP